MPNNPIGISFLPSQEQAAMGPHQGQMEGVPEQAFKILSMRLPRVLGARAMSPEGLMNAPGSAGMGGNPLAAVFEALLKTMSGGQPGGWNAPQMPRYKDTPPTGGTFGPSLPPGSRPPSPKFVPGDKGPQINAPVFDSPQGPRISEDGANSGGGFSGPPRKPGTGYRRF